MEVFARSGEVRAQYLLLFNSLLPLTLHTRHTPAGYTITTMTIANLFAPSALRMEVIRLYRDILRSLKPVRLMYQIDYTPAQMASRIRAEFEKNRTVTDPNVINRLVFVGRTELEEALSLYKTKSHILRLVAPTHKTAQQVLHNPALKQHQHPQKPQNPLH